MRGGHGRRVTQLGRGREEKDQGKDGGMEKCRMEGG